MSIRLVVRQRSEEGAAGEAREVIVHEPIVNLGRDKTSQVMLPLQAVSRTHARISRDGALFFIEDLGSVYGTQVNGQALPKGEKRLLRDGDLIAIAQFDVSFERLPDVPKEFQADETSMVARHMVKNAMRALGSGEGPYLRMMNGPDEGQHIALADARELVFGREEEVDVVLKDDLVSRRHAKVRRDWAGTHIEDLGSRNGVRVNKKRVTRKTLTDRDEVEIGGVKLLYVDPTEVHDARPAPVLEEEEENTPPPQDPPPDEEEEKEEPEPSAPPPSDDEEQSGALSGLSDPGQDSSVEEPLPPEPSLSQPVAALDAQGAGPELEGRGEVDESDYAEESPATTEEAPPPAIGIRHWIILGSAALAAVILLALVLAVLIGI